MIPKILHYVGVGGGKMPLHTKKMLEKNKKILGDDGKIMVGTDEHRNLGKSEPTDYFYKKKEWAFVSDYVRAGAVLNHGGVYIDTDISLEKSLDSLINYDYFASRTFVVFNTASIFGAAKHSTILKDYLSIASIKAVYRKTPKLMSTHFHAFALRKSILIPDTNTDYVEDNIAVFAEDLLQVKVNERNIAIHHHHKNGKGNAVIGAKSEEYSQKKSNLFKNNNKKMLLKYKKESIKIFEKLTKIESKSTKRK